MPASAWSLGQLTHTQTHTHTANRKYTVKMIKNVEEKRGAGKTEKKNNIFIHTKKLRKT